MALFGEKYGDRVRVVRTGDFSTELCGGTHCRSSAEIGLVKVTSERGIASGTRRIEAVTGDGALDRFREAQGIVRGLEDLLAVPATDLVEEVSRRLDALRGLQKELQRARLASIREDLLAEAERASRGGGTPVLARRVDGLAPSEMRELADNLRQKLGSGVVVLGRAQGGKASLLVAVTDDLTDRLSAGDLVKSLAKRIGGGGGGRKDLAEAGGKNPDGLDDALAAAPGEVAAGIAGSE